MRLDSRAAPLVIGDDFDIERTVKGIPDGDTLAQAWFTLKESDADLDEDAVIKKRIDLDAEPGVGHITDAGETDHKGELIFQLTNEDTVALEVRTYFYDIQVKTAAGKIYTRELGTVTPKQQITRAT